MIDDQLTFSEHIAKTAWSCRFALRSSGPFFRNMPHNSLFKLLFCRGWDFAMLSWQVFQPVLSNQRMYLTHSFINLHWLPIAACIKFKALMFAYKTTTGSAPLYLNELFQTYVPSRNLCSAGEYCFIVPSQRGTKSFSRTFKLNVPSWWNDLPSSIRAAESLAIFKNWLKTHLFHLYLTL